MGIGNNLRILRAKWWIIVLAAILGAVIGMYLARSHNNSIDSRWRAQAPVTFINFTEEDLASAVQNKAPNSTNSDIDAQAEGVRAQLLLEDVLKADPRLSIQVDRANNILLFTAIGSDGEETLQKAVDLRSQYQDLSSQVLNIDQINETIDALLVEITALNEQIASVEVPEPEPEDPAITTARATLEAEIASMNERQTQLRIWIFNPELRPTEDEFYGTDPEVVTPERGTTNTTTDEPPPIITKEAIEDEFDLNTRTLAKLNTQLMAIPPVPVAAELDNETALELAAWQAEAESLQEQYVELLQVASGRSPGGFFEEPTATDETAATRPVGIFTFVGLLAGALIASIVLVGLDKTRRTVWSATSLGGISCLGMIDRNRTDGRPDAIWYPTSVSRRRRDIQTLRSTMDAITQEQPAIIGFFGVSTPGSEVGELAADLATAYSVAGRSVLLIDANAFDPNDLAEYGTQSASLTALLVQNLAVDDVAAEVESIIESAPEPTPHLTALHVDAGEYDPIDAIASPTTRSLVDRAREQFDVVIVAGPAMSDPLSDAVIRRIDFAVLTGLAGVTTEPQITTASAILGDRRTRSPGVVLLHGRRQSLRASLTNSFHRTRAAIESTVDRVGNDRNGDDGGTAAEADSPSAEETPTRV